MTPPSQERSANPTCPKCNGPMWDNREGKRNPKAPDFKCKDRECGGVIWPHRTAGSSAPAPEPTVAPATPRQSDRTQAAPSASARAATAASTGPGVGTDGMPLCPVCGGPMWDDRASKRNPRAPDFKCRNRPRERGGPGCEGVIWPARDGSPSPYPPPVPRRTRTDAGRGEPPPTFDGPPPEEPPAWGDDEPPF